MLEVVARILEDAGLGGDGAGLGGGGAGLPHHHGGQEGARH